MILCPYWCIIREFRMVNRTRKTDPKTAPKISVKIWEPIIKKLDTKLKSACLRRDAYLNKILEVELDWLDDEVSLPNSQDSYDFVFDRLQELKLKLVSQVPLRLAANSVIKQALAEEAKGCEVIISGKLQQQRAKSMKFKQGYMISSGQPKLDYLDVAIRHVFFKQGIMGVKVKIMKSYDPNNKQCASKPLPDFVEIADPKKDDNEEKIFSRVDDQHR